MTNHLWQSTLFALAAALLTLAFRKNRAAVRYWLWFSASVKFLVPFALLTMLGGRVERHVGQPALPVRLMPLVQISEPFPNAPSFPPQGHRDWTGDVIFSAWACGFLGVALMRLRGWRDVRAAVRSSTAFEMAAPIEVRSSPGLLEPGVVGIWRPVLLLPAGVEQRLTPSQFQAVLAHELCHAQRRDNLTSAIHMLVETVFWFHPLVWWIGARLVEERERACDEEVLRRGSEPRDYAEAIVSICRLYAESPLACVSGVTGSNLKKRIEEIIANRVKPGLSAGKKLVLAAGGLLAVTISVIVGVSNVQLRGQTAPEQGAGVPSWQSAAGGKMTFDEASVRRSPPPPPRLPRFPLNSDDAYVPGGEFYADFPLSAYITFAYKMSPTKAQYESMFALWPKWVTMEPFEIQAKAAGNPTKDQMRLMMQSLLARRFGLAVHYESRVVPVFALTLKEPGKLGPNLRPHDDGLSCEDTGLPRIPLGGTSDFQCGGFGMWNGPGGISRVGARGATMAALAAALPSSASLRRPVIDQTGLSGRFDLQIKWEFETVVVAPFRAEPDLPGPLFLEALREQLGLNLESTTAPVRSLIIDHVERPVEN